MNVLKTFTLLIAVLFAVNCTAQSSQKTQYKEGLVAYFLQHENKPMKTQLKLTALQDEAFDKIMSHYRQRRMSTVGTKNQRKKEIKNIAKEQDKTIKTILRPNQFSTYQMLMRQKRAGGYKNVLRG